MAAANPSVSSQLSNKSDANKLNFNWEVKGKPAHSAFLHHPKSPLFSLTVSSASDLL